MFKGMVPPGLFQAICVSGAPPRPNRVLQGQQKKNEAQEKKELLYHKYIFIYIYIYIYIYYYTPLPLNLANNNNNNNNKHFSVPFWPLPHQNASDLLPMLPPWSLGDALAKSQF